MLYEECMTCKKRGTVCNGPNFMTMTTAEIIDWIDKFQHIHGITNAKLAEMSQTPKGTIDGIKARKHGDIRHETLRPILSALMGGTSLGDKPCPYPNNDEKELMEAKLLHAKQMNEHKDATLKLYEAELKARNHAIYILLTICAIITAGLVAYLYVDLSLPNTGLITNNPSSPFAILMTILLALGVCLIAAYSVYNLVRKKKMKKGDTSKEEQ